ncbi:MAG: divalent cation tolerance protein CutA, partial [Cyanobacteria bacterium J06631_6]
EYQLIIKTDLNQFAQLSAKIKTLHSYEVPEIIALPIVNGSQAYLNWLGSSLED